MERIILYLLLGGWLFVGKCHSLLYEHNKKSGNFTTKSEERNRSMLNMSEEILYDAAVPIDPRAAHLEEATHKKATGVQKLLLKGVWYSSTDCLNIIYKKNKCRWLRETEDCRKPTNGRFWNYMEVLFCYMDEKYMYIWIICMVMFLPVLVAVVMLICTKFYVSSLLAIATMMHLSDNFAGVTLISFINGLADIFASIQYVRSGKTDVQYSYIMGGSLIMIVLLVGVVCINTPFRIQGPQFLRDCIFTLAAVIYSFIILKLGYISIMGIAGLFLLYFVYILLVIVHYFVSPEYMQDLPNYQQRSTALSHVGSFKANQWLRTSNINSALTPGSVPVFPHRPLIYGEKMVIVKSISYKEELFYQLNPINIQHWHFASTGVKLCIILQAPLVFLFTLLIPVVDFSKTKNGWSKPLNVLQALLSPVLCVFIHGSWSSELLPGVQLYLIVVLFSLVFGLFVIYTAPRFSAPGYHFMFALISLGTSVAMMNVAVNEIMAILSTVGAMMYLKPPTLGCTVLAWGLCLGDFFTVVILSQRGYYRMGFAVCYGSAIFNICIVLGVAFFAYYVKGGVHSEKSDLKIEAGILAPGIVLYMVCGLISCLVMLPVMGFQARRSYGFYLLVLFVLFNLRTGLSELGLQHPIFSVNQVLNIFPNGTTIWEHPIPID